MEELNSVKPLKKFKVNWKLECWYSGKPVLPRSMSVSEVSPVFYSLLICNALLIFIYRYWGSPVDRNISPNNVNLCVLIFGFSSGRLVAIILMNHDEREGNWSEAGSPGMSEAWTEQSMWDLHPHSNKKNFWHEILMSQDNERRGYQLPDKHTLFQKNSINWTLNHLSASTDFNIQFQVLAEKRYSIVSHF